MTMDHAPAVPQGKGQEGGGMSCSHGGGEAIDLNEIEPGVPEVSDFDGTSHEGASEDCIFG